MKPGDEAYVYTGKGDVHKVKVVTKNEDNEDDDPSTVYILIWGQLKECSREYIYPSKAEALRAYQIDKILEA